MASLPASQGPPLVGVVPLCQKGLPTHAFYPSIAGSAATGLSGVWRVRGDKVTSIYAKEFRAAGVVDGPEMDSIDAAITAFLGL